MEVTNVIAAKNIVKKFKAFELNIPEITIPEGFATALIGENGAGKTTLLSILAGTRLDYDGEIEFFGKYTDKDRDRTDCPVRERMGFTSGSQYFMPHWTVSQIKQMSSYLYGTFNPETFDNLNQALGLTAGNKKFSDLSDGNKMKLVMSAAFARDIDLILMDEPASPLDPLMRDTLCQLIREYIDKPTSEGKPRTAVFSTHNIADMESVTDYAIIIEHGNMVEAGFVDDLKEKYILVKGEPEQLEAARPYLFTVTESKYGFEGICLATELDKLAGIGLHTETPTLTQISVAVMKKNTSIKKLLQ